MTDVRSRLVDALAEFFDRNNITVGTAHPTLAADWLLLRPGIAIVELPEPVQFDPAYDCVGRWRVGECGAVIAYSDGYLIDETGREVGPPPIAREFAAALLAAAVQAQEEQQ